MSELKPISECRTVAELLADRSRWTQATNARDRLGNPVTPMDGNACCFCVRGAAWKIAGGIDDNFKAKRGKFAEVINTYDVTLFNDTHTYEEVYQKVLEAGI